MAREVARAAVDEVFGALDEGDLLQAALDKRLRARMALSDPAVQRRLYTALVRQGFDAHSVGRAIRQRVQRAKDGGRRRCTMHNAIHGTRITEHILAASKCISRSEASIPTSFHEPAASVAIPVNPAERSVIERDVPFIAIPCLLTRGAIARRRCGLAYIEGGAARSSGDAWCLPATDASVVTAHQSPDERRGRQPCRRVRPEYPCDQP